ncbi:MAG: hypothetical protein ACJ788_20800 [Ktedonobacteraceae bacterium]
MSNRIGSDTVQSPIKSPKVGRLGQVPGDRGEYSKATVEPVNPIYTLITIFLHFRMLETREVPHVPIQTHCPAGRILRGEAIQSTLPQRLQCQSGQEYCFVSCALSRIIFKRSYDAGEEIARGVISGYCILQDTNFVRRTAVFTAPPQPEPIDPTMPF